MTPPLQPVTVAQYGIGPIGAEIARLLLAKKWVRLVGAVDIDPNKAGKDVGDVIGLGRSAGVTVTSELQGKPEVVCHSTGSRLRDVAPQLRALLEAGCHVVSTCEELSFPLDAALREELQQVARANNVTLLGTGVNPGFVMDKLPLTVTSVCQDIKSVQIVRIQNASTRREPLQRKVGAGMTPEEFRMAVDAGKIKHMGLKESLMMVGNGLGVEFEHVSDERIEPIVAPREIVTQYLKVAPGQVAGVHQTIEGHGRINVSLELRMYVGAEDLAADRVVVRGTPDVEMEIRGGIHGDRATAAMVVNAIPRVISARPGVLTMDDIAISFR
ncbi:MAG TPA: dihydrodipicolinate reductase [Thermoanaerobaculia bacterium]|nr:dihydrodipicolinate reductase [Thermoanaerobaculia bacterium]